MRGSFRNIAAGASGLALSASAAWADSAPATPAPPGFATFQGPAWTHYGPAPWIAGNWGDMPVMVWGGYGDAWVVILFAGVILAALIVCLFRVLAWAGHAGPFSVLPHLHRGSPGLHTLDERYARGEITREDYLQKKKDILS